MNEYETTPGIHAMPTHTLKRRFTMEIKVLGPGCPKCKQTEETVKQAVSEAGV